MQALERRLQAAEDRLAIYQIVSTYGPSVDSLSKDILRGMYTSDGVYDHTAGIEPYTGNDGIAGLIDGAQHLGYVEKGCAHVTSLPHVVVQGDSAVATCYSRVYLKDGDCWRLERVSANRWELQRTTDGWRVKHRTNRLLNGDDAPRRLLGRGLRSATAG
jgi:hypothetical protein